MRRAFSMIELIFIIVILGILASVMSVNMPDNRLRTDTNFIIQKIKEKQIYALSYDNFNYVNNQFFDDRTCLFINKEILNTNEKNNVTTKPYQISSKTILMPNDLNVCFDNLGRPYKFNNFVKMPIVFNISYKDRDKVIKIMPFSGSVIKK